MGRQGSRPRRSRPPTPSSSATSSPPCPRSSACPGGLTGVVKANLAFAATVIAVLVIWDVVWILPLPLGVAGHEGSTMVVGLNGLRLLRREAWRKADEGLL